ncbi:DUF2442 domain-containing protein [Elstera cyanobacteriorum]|uniref:DUF2442 domain-containing protein n=1 Tax=Elstera cyanobacteriorum TaxID=2022747 RepID=UPI002353C15E|nr:DUF2442 domain-containing protein [Elstera cyanobacteriorum]MCK6442418.1 DUF2442 domain-containing protein [Elstera cyanobacteriorum]
MELTDSDIEMAEARSKAQHARWPHAVKVRFNRHTRRVVISLSNGVEVSFSPKQAQGFETATDADLGEAEISPSGLAVFFPRLNADIYIPGLLQGSLGSELWDEARRRSA